MKGRTLLETLPESIKQLIIEKYESLDNYLDFVVQLYASNRDWSMVQTEEARVKRYEIQMKIFDLGDELDRFGLKEDIDSFLENISTE